MCRKLTWNAVQGFRVCLCLPLMCGGTARNGPASWRGRIQLAAHGWRGWRRWWRPPSSAGAARGRGAGWGCSEHIQAIRMEIQGNSQSPTALPVRLGPNAHSHIHTRAREWRIRIYTRTTPLRGSSRRALGGRWAKAATRQRTSAAWARPRAQPGAATTRRYTVPTPPWSTSTMAR